MSDFWESLVCIGVYPDAEAAHDRGLVILSQGESYWLGELDDGTFELLVLPDRAEFLLRQVELYEIESAYWPPEEPEVPGTNPAANAVTAWVAALLLSYMAQLRWPELLGWGQAASESIRSGEVYRVLTALFLHADIGHLTGNVVFGGVFLYLVARQLGGWQSWVALLVAGAVGNLFNALAHIEEPHYSIGASTAVFACVGILVSLPLGYFVRHVEQQVFRMWMLPLGAGMVFLAWFGTGSEFTDTSAHLMGFLAGLPAGFIAGLLKRSP